MESHHSSGGAITLMEAVEALTAIAETHWEQEPLQFVSEEDLKLTDPHWLLSSDEEHSRETVKEIFKAVLKHLKQFYHSEHTLATDSKTLEGIKTIMVLVGEAAKKIDQYTRLFDEAHGGSAAKLHEYRQLQDFYKKKISRTIDESLLGKWLLALTRRTFTEHELKKEEGMRGLETRHLFVDLESIKQDKDYELFFIRKEDGTRFFNPRIVRNMKLVADFGSRLGSLEASELFLDQMIWEDRRGNGTAQGILRKISPELSKSYADLVKNKDRDCQGELNKALMALFLASNPQRLISSGSSKGCLSYFFDFQMYLRNVLESREYQRWIAYPLEERSKSEEATLKIVQAILKAVFEGSSGNRELNSYLSYLIEEGYKNLSQEHLEKAHLNRELWGYLASDRLALKKVLKTSPYASLGRILEDLEDGDFQQYDPWMQGKVPERLWTFKQHGMDKGWIVLPTPTRQEYIHQAKVTEEFLGFLNAHLLDEGQALLLNFQDRTGWHEHARSHALENLEGIERFAPFFHVATLPVDTEFYWQMAPYSEDHQAILFKEHFREHFADNHGGFYLSDRLREKLHSRWFEEMIDGVHQFFFDGRNVLSKEARCDFIEIAYLLIELKLLEAVNPSLVFAVCKDGVDLAPAASALIRAYSYLLYKDALSKEERHEISAALNAPALLDRHRIIHQERFDRMLNALKVLEIKQKELGADEFRKQLKSLFGPYCDVG